MSDLLPDMLPDEYTDADTEQRAAIKYSARRCAARDVYARLLTKKRNTGKLNFGEVRGNTTFAQTFGERVPTPELIRTVCGDGYFIIEHMLGNSVFDYSFVIVEPDVRVLSAPDMPTQPQNYYTPQAPDTFEQELGVTLNCVLSNMKDNAPVFTAARSVVWLFRTFPQESAQLQQLLEQPAGMIQATIAQMIPQAAEIVNAPHAGAWLDKLKANVSKRLQRGTAQPADTQAEGAPRADVSNVVELSGRAS